MDAGSKLVAILSEMQPVRVSPEAIIERVPASSGRASRTSFRRAPHDRPPPTMKTGRFGVGFHMTSSVAVEGRPSPTVHRGELARPALPNSSQEQRRPMRCDGPSSCATRGERDRTAGRVAPFGHAEPLEASPGPDTVTWSTVRSALKSGDRASAVGSRTVGCCAIDVVR